MTPRRNSKEKALEAQKFTWNGQSAQGNSRAKEEPGRTPHTTEEVEAEAIVGAVVASIATTGRTPGRETAREHHRNPTALTATVQKSERAPAAAVRSTEADPLAAMIASITLNLRFITI